MYLQMKNEECFTTLLDIEQAACCWPSNHCIISARTPWQLFHLISTALHSSIHGCNVHCKLPSFSLYPHGFFFSSRSELCLLKYLGFAREWYTVNTALPSSGARIGLYIESKRANTDGQQENKSLTQQVSQSLPDLSRYFCRDMGWEVYWGHQDLNLESSCISWDSRISLTLQTFS